MHNAASPDLPTPPGDSVTRLGRYQIIGELGSGGTSRIFLARATGEAGFQRLFALKVLRKHLADDDEYVQMFLDEARLTSGLHHPNIVSIVDLGRDQGRYFLVMDYVEGGSVAQLCRTSPNTRSPRLFVPLFIDALEGLHAAHVLTDDNEVPLRIVHRDFSAQNIMVGVDGVARVVDFGIAKADARITSTCPGILKGRAGLISPEQLESPDDVDGRADVFAAGATLWSVLTGRPLFAAGSDAETLLNVLTMPVEPPSTVGLRPPPCFDAICLKALARDRSQRYPTAAAMAAELRAAAFTNGMLADRVEIAAWVKSTFGRELAVRRAAVRQRTADARAVFPSGEGLRMPSLTPTPSVPPSASVRARRVTPFALAEAPAHRPDGRTARFFSAGLFAALGGIGGAIALCAIDDARPASRPPPALEATAPPPPTATVRSTSLALVPLPSSPRLASSSSASASVLTRDARAPLQQPAASSSAPLTGPARPSP